MSYLYLVQHAKAKPKQADPKQALSEKGQADIDKVAAYIAKLPLLQPPAQIIHSGKTRAQQTANVLAQALSPINGVKSSANLSPMANVSLWAERLNTLSENVMLVGHLPHLSKLAALLLCQNEEKQVINFQNAGLVCLHKDDKGVWSGQWIITPQTIV